MRLSSQKKILREDLADAPDWIDRVIEPINSFMENVYQLANKNITDADNVAAQIYELTYRTTAAYPVMDPVYFQSSLRTKASGLVVLQAVDKTTYEPVAGPVYVPWLDINGAIKLYSITGLAASKSYLIRLRLT